MKKTLIIVAAMLLSVITSFAQDGRSIYNKYSDYETVSAVYISPAMFKLIGKIPDVNVEDVDFSSVIKSLNGFYLLDTEDPEILAKMNADVDKFIASGKYELLMEAKDGKDKARFYTIGNKDIVTGLVMKAQSDQECTFIYIDGQINQKDLETMLSKANK